MVAEGKLTKTVGPLLFGTGNLMSEEMENAVILNFSDSVFHWQVSVGF